MTNPGTPLATALADRYRIERELGQGGMATVYLAEDLKHKRKVALKVLKPELAAVLGAERFVQEITTTASLQHPHILPLFDSGTVGGFLFYVMPYIQGETLRDKLNRETQLGVHEAVKIASEVADALHYAHTHGVIHRDIKPENILLANGRPMVADFGIALAVSAAAGGRMTETGLSLGTPHYMSPEQATAEKEITARSDVYSLGSVLYEMLAGQPPHLGGSAQQIIMKIITEQAQPVTALRKSVSPNVAAAVAKSLEKLPADRFTTAAEFATALTDRSFTTATAFGQAGAQSFELGWRRIAIGAAITAVVLGVLAAFGWMREDARRLVRRFTITLDQYDPAWSGTTLSHDGSRMAYYNAEGALLLRNAADQEARLIPGSGEAWAPTFSPDDREIAITTGFPGVLKVIPVDGGASRTLVADSVYGTGLAWTDDGWIYYTYGPDYGRELKRIRASGGAAELVTRPDSARNELFYYLPQALPGGRKLLLTVYPYTGDPNVGVLDLKDGRVTLIAPGVAAYYAASGHLIVVQGDGMLKGARFDASSGTVVGGFTTLAEGLNVNAAGSPLTLSNEGTVMYLPVPPGGAVVRVSRTGVEEVIDREWTGVFGPPSFSPTGDRIAVSVTRGGRVELWVKSLGSGAFTKLSALGTQNYRPSWSRDGRDIVFTSDLGGKISSYRVPADRITPPSRLFEIAKSVDESEFSSDGQWIVFRTGSGGARDIYARRTTGDTSVKAIAAGPSEEFSPALSPDNRWIAYGSEETGRTEVYVRPFPDAGAARHPVSSNGGTEPRWSHSGRELFYRDGAGNLVSVSVAPGATFSIGAPRVLFSARGYVADSRHHHYSVSPDDRSFLFVKAGTREAVSQLTVVLNWFEELRERVGK